MTINSTSPKASYLAAMMREGRTYAEESAREAEQRLKLARLQGVSDAFIEGMLGAIAEFHQTAAAYSTALAALEGTPVEARLVAAEAAAGELMLHEAERLLNGG